MSYIPSSCTTSQANVSIAQCVVDIKQAQKLLVAAPGFYLPKDEWLDNEKITGYIAAKKLAPIALISLIEDPSAGDIVEEVGGNEQVNSHGESRFKWQVNVSQCQYPDLKTLEQRSNSPFDAYIVDKSNKIMGLFDVNGDMYPLPMNTLTVGPPPITTDGATSAKTYIVARFDTEEIAFAQPGYVPTGLKWKSIDGLIDVNLSDATAAAAVVTVTVLTSCGGVPVTGLAFGDFADIDSKAASSLVETVPGTYDVTYATAPVTGTYSVELKAPTLQTSKTYETQEAAELRVV